jgi:hypothetical protein
VHTKSGHDNPGSEFEGYGGSFGRRSVQGETGGEAGPFDYFLTGLYFDEAGWRDGSRTQLYQGFGKVGWQNDKTDIDSHVCHASLLETALSPLSLLGGANRATPGLHAQSAEFVNLIDAVPHRPPAALAVATAIWSPAAATATSMTIIWPTPTAAPRSTARNRRRAGRKSAFAPMAKPPCPA